VVVESCVREYAADGTGAEGGVDGENELTGACVES